MSTPHKWPLVLVMAAVLALLGAAILARSASAQESGGELDGLTFEGETGEDGSEVGDDDIYIFQNGTFRSTACEQWGFKAATYTAKTEGDAIVFDAVAKSDTEGTMSWHGRVEDDEIEGYAIWEKPGQDTIEYWFYGYTDE